MANGKKKAVARRKESVRRKATEKRKASQKRTVSVRRIFETEMWGDVKQIGLERDQTETLRPGYIEEGLEMMRNVARGNNPELAFLVQLEANGMGEVELRDCKEFMRTFILKIIEDGAISNFRPFIGELLDKKMVSLSDEDAFGLDNLWLNIVIGERIGESLGSMARPSLEWMEAFKGKVISSELPADLIHKVNDDGYLSQRLNKMAPIFLVNISGKLNHICQQVVQSILVYELSA